MKKILFILFLLPLSIFAQQDKDTLEKEARQFVREGNELYNQLKFADAEVKYKKALEKSPDYEIANYNLGNALSQQNRNKEAVIKYELVAKTTKDKFTRASSMHNIGNAHYKDKEYQKAVDSYKHSLRANPKDDETRYNLALAQEMLKNQQENEDKNKDNKDNKDDKKDKDKEKDKKDDKKDGDDKKDEDKKDDEKKDDEDKKDPNKDKKDEEQKQQPQQGKLSPQQVKQLLEAMNNEEQKTQKKMNAKKERGKKIKQEKDW
ncbi:MAG: DNA primase [Lutibacter sp.]|nr:MAG: DNA primase [Lutibacter sp.]